MKKGFTLIELLAVILILGIIALIAVSTITEIIEDSRKEKAKISFKNYINALENSIIVNHFTNNKLPEDYFVIKDVTNLDIKGVLPSKGYFALDSNDTIVNAMMCIDGFYLIYRNDQIIISSDKNCEDLYAPKLLKDVILEKYNISDEPSTNLGTEISTMDEKELLSSEDSLGMSYYFRGNVDDNYVMIKDILFRIIRINGDGTFRLIADNSIGNYAYSTLYNDKKYMGYTYLDSDGTIKDSTIKQAIDDWYNKQIKPNIVNNLLSKGKFCNDVRLYETGEYNLYTYAYNRLVTNGNPTFLCDSPELELYAGLISADEAVFAGAAYGIQNKNFYLYNGDYWYTITPISYGSRIRILYYSNTDNSILREISSYYERGTRPVINLKKYSKVIFGDGTKENPYYIFG